jgi:hypothetical protein
MQALGNPGAVLNSASVPFDPPLEREHSILILSFKVNVSGIPWFFGDDAFRWENRVNSQPFNVQASNYFMPVPYISDDYGGAARVASVRPVRKRQGGIIYWEVTTEMEIDFIWGWRQHVVDRGMQRRACAGDPDGEGGTISQTDIQAGDAAHAPIIGQDGHPLTEPVLLDGNGQPLDVCNEEPVYLTYRTYDEFRFQNAFNLGWERVIN